MMLIQFIRLINPIHQSEDKLIRLQKDEHVLLQADDPVYRRLNDIEVTQGHAVFGQRTLFLNQGASLSSDGAEKADSRRLGSAVSASSEVNLNLFVSQPFLF